MEQCSKYEDLNESVTKNNVKKIDDNFQRAIVVISGPAEVENLYVKILKDDIY